MRAGPAPRAGVRRPVARPTRSAPGRAGRRRSGRSPQSRVRRLTAEPGRPRRRLTTRRAPPPGSADSRAPRTGARSPPVRRSTSLPASVAHLPMTGRTTETAPNRQVLSPMRALPSGTVTFLFSDIEGSTHLAERLGDRWPVLLGEHRTIVREAVASGGGTEVGTEGDSFFVAFPTAGGAVSAAVEAQRQLADHAWPEEAAIRIRIGLHTGEASLAGSDYVGLDVHRAARIASAGHGGQVLVSDTTRALVESSLPEGVTTRDLGQRRLKDLSRPERIHQLVIEGLPSEFPPLKTLDATPNNRPIQLSSFLGRERELDEVEALLERSRLLTLTGPGGTGKTRLSLQVGAREADRFPDGIFFVPLSPLRAPELVPGTIAQELGLPDRGGLSPMTALTDHLR